MDLLWENPSPDSIFNSQTVNVPGLQNHKYIMIAYRGSGSMLGTFVVPTNQEGSFSVVSPDLVVLVSRVTTISGDSITFADNRVYSVLGSSSFSINNNSQVPLAIWGID